MDVMLDSIASTGARKGGAWLIEDTLPTAVFTPEKCSEEQRLIGRTTDEFVRNEVIPALDRLEQKDWTLARELLQRSAALGLLSVDAPERYGGMELDKVSSLVVSERLAPAASFAATVGAQTNLTVMPIVLFGTEAQRQKYLPRLLSGELVGAYALSEAGSGSDALGAKATATRQADGSFLLNGEKMWITSGGFADVFIVFAKVDGEAFSAFIVERVFGGVTSGHEERKMGLHGSSTTALILQDVPVPAENLLGKIGKGHRVAFNVLNWGRFKLGGMCCGAAKVAIGEAARYAAQRKQFGHPIASFGAIKHKLAEMTVRTYAVESMIYRTAGLIDALIQAMADEKRTTEDRTLAAVEEFAIESSMAKVAGTETLNDVLDENIQIHGGNGYVRDYPAERHYRDARVNRIFEGTNEINRLLIPGMLARRALKGDLPLIAAAKRLQDELLGPPTLSGDSDEGRLADERRLVNAAKKVGVMILGMAMQTFGQKLSDEQEVLTYAADILIDAYAAESALLRALDAAERDLADAALQTDAARVYVAVAATRVEMAARQALAAIVEGDALRVALAALRRLLKGTPINTVTLRRQLADATTARGEYVFA